jgi:hypothetical protein
VSDSPHPKGVASKLGRTRTARATQLQVRRRKRKKVPIGER